MPQPVRQQRLSSSSLGAHSLRPCAAHSAAASPTVTESDPFAPAPACAATVSGAELMAFLWILSLLQIEVQAGESKQGSSTQQRTAARVVTAAHRHGWSLVRALHPVRRSQCRLGIAAGERTPAVIEIIRLARGMHSLAFAVSLAVSCEMVARTRV